MWKRNLRLFFMSSIKTLCLQENWKSKYWRDIVLELVWKKRASKISSVENSQLLVSDNSIDVRTCILKRASMWRQVTRRCSWRTVTTQLYGTRSWTCLDVPGSAENDIHIGVWISSLFFVRILLEEVRWKEVRQKGSSMLPDCNKILQLCFCLSVSSPRFFHFAAISRIAYTFLISSLCSLAFLLHVIRVVERLPNFVEWTENFFI